MGKNIHACIQYVHVERIRGEGSTSSVLAGYMLELSFKCLLCRTESLNIRFVSHYSSAQIHNSVISS